MIVLNLHCRNGHRFEGWFASADAFEAQRRERMVACPVCNDGEVTRLPSGPRVVSSVRGEGPAEDVATVQALLLDAMKAYVRGADDVGRRFADEARKIHYKEVPERRIRGVATTDEARDLAEEGIEILPLPPVLGEDNH